MNFKEFRRSETLITEGAEARIQHAEDLIFWEGSQGALRALDALESLSRSGINHTSVKWDGSPSLIFGNDENGEFVLTDKSGFYAKGYDGKAKSPDELREMFLNRSGGKNRENSSYVEFANKMAQIFYIFKNAIPKGYKGFFKGDLLYYNKPGIKNGHYIFQPNVVQYEVDLTSDLGKRISKSEAGVVIHRAVDFDGNEQPLKDLNIFKGNDLLVIPPVFVEHKAQVDLENIKSVKKIISQNNLAINSLIDENILKQKQIADFPQVLYKYLNSKVDTGLENIGSDFFDWLATQNISTRKKQNITQHIQENSQIFNVLWQIVNMIMDIKDDIVQQFDNNAQVVKQTMAGERGGEGYVYSNKNGDIKLVPRRTFSRINRSIER